MVGFGTRDALKGIAAGKHTSLLDDAGEWIQLIEALRKDFNVPDPKFVTASLAQTKEGSTGGAGVILSAMKAVAERGDPEPRGKVGLVYTHPLSMGGGSIDHYAGNPETYMSFGEATGKSMVKLQQGE